MSNSNPRYLRAWPDEEFVAPGSSGTVTSVGSGSGLLGGPITTAGSLSVDYGSPADILAGTDNVKLFHAAALAGASVAGLSAGAGDAGKLVKLDASGALSPSVFGLNAIAASAGAADAAKLIKTDATGKIDPSFLPAAGGTGTVTSIATGAGLAGGPITTTGTISLAASGVAAGASGSGAQVPVVTVDVYGRVTSISTQPVTPAWANVTGTPTTLAGYGITDAVPSTASVSGGSSLSGGGALSGAPLTISLVNDAAAPGNGYYYGTDGAGVKGYHVLPAGGGGGGGGTGTVTSITAGAGLAGGTISTSGTIALAASGAAAGTYTSVTVDTYGRVTAGTNPTTLAGYGITDATASTRQIIAGTGMSGGGDFTADRTLSLANTAITAGTYQGITFDAQGRATAAVDKGFVVGPASATDMMVARYDGATGKLIQNSGVMIDDGGNMGVNTTPLARVDVNGTSAHNVVGTTGAMDLSVGHMFACTVTGPTSWSFANTPAGRGVTVVLNVANGGSQTMTWPANLRFPGGTAPTLTALGVDILVFITYDGGISWRGNVFGKNI